MQPSWPTLGIGLVCALLSLLGVGSTGPGSSMYEVSAPALSVTGGPVYACFAILESWPPTGCGGVVVRGLDIERVAGVQRYPDGTLATPSLHLVGSWDGRVLTLTEPPRPATPTPLPDACTQVAGFTESPEEFARQTQINGINRDGNDRPILILATLPCDETTIGAVLAVADDNTIKWLTSHYAPIKIAGWLTPVPPEP